MTTKLSSPKTELKPCPNLGCKEYMVALHVDVCGHFAKCGKCGLRTGGYELPEPVIRIWNDLPRAPQWLPIKEVTRDMEERLFLNAKQGDTKTLARWSDLHKVWLSKGTPIIAPQWTHFMNLPLLSKGICEWREDVDGIWNYCEGYSFINNEDGRTPSEDGLKECPLCNKTIKEIPFKESDQ